MSTLNAESDLPYRNLYRRHRRSDSGELEVFDATSYFSGEEMHCHADPLITGGLSQKIACEERCPFGGSGGGDKSLDDPFSTIPPSQCQTDGGDKKSSRKSKSRNPGSPGSKLATFLNSLFAPMAGGKKKPKPNQSSASAKDGEENYGRVKRRSSMSYLQIASDSAARSVISASGFQSPLSPSLNPRIWKEIDGFSNSKARSVTLFPPSTPLYERRCINIAWLDQKFLFSDAVYENFNYAVKNKDRNLQKEKGGGKNGDLIDGFMKKGGNNEKERRNVCEDEWTNQMKKEMKWLDDCSEEEATKKVKEEMEEGFESDSSSDLFELQKL